MRFVRSGGRSAIWTFVIRAGRRQLPTSEANLAPLESVLARLDADIRRQHAALTETQERLAADTAFLVEEIESHEIGMDDPRLAVLEGSIGRAATRGGLLLRELRFIEESRRSLAAFLDQET